MGAIDEIVLGRMLSRFPINLIYKMNPVFLEVNFLGLIINVLITTLRYKCLNRELFLVCFFLYSFQYRKIRTRINSAFRHFSRSANFTIWNDTFTNHCVANMLKIMEEHIGKTTIKIPRQKSISLVIKTSGQTAWC